MELQVNNVTLYYEVYGSGKPLLMLHGNGETHKIFDRAIDVLKNHYTVYAIDTRGHGQSSGVSEFHYDDMVMDIKCFIEALQLKKPVLYGFSDGAIIGLLLASRYPDLLSALIASGANLTPDGLRTGWLKLFQWIYKKTNDSKMKMMLEEPNITAKELGKITIPTTILAGGRDMIKRSHTREIAAAIPGSNLKILHGYGHGGYIVHKRKIAKLILEALHD